MQPQSVSISSQSVLPELLVECLSDTKPHLFELGQTVCTRSIAEWAEENLPDVLKNGSLWAGILVKAHVTGCWYELPAEDQDLNKKSLELGNEGRIFSAYTILDEKIFVITEWDRSVTTVMLADDY